MTDSIDEKKLKEMWDKIYELEQYSVADDSKDRDIIKKIEKIIGEVYDKCY